MKKFQDLKKWEWFFIWISNKKAKADRHPNDPKFTKRAEGVIAIATVANVFFTLVLAICAISADKIYNQQLAVYKNQLNVQKLDQRAWVTVFDIQVEKTPSGKTYFKVLYKNTGKTPALEVNACIAYTSYFHEIPDFDKEPSNSSGQMSPGGTFNTSTISKPLSVRDINRIKNGQIPLYIFGTIWYKDIYDVHHWTQFCFSLLGSFTAEFAYEPSKKHNLIDKAEE